MTKQKLQQQNLFLRKQLSREKTKTKNLQRQVQRLTNRLLITDRALESSTALNRKYLQADSVIKHSAAIEQNHTLPNQMSIEEVLTNARN